MRQWREGLAALFSSAAPALLSIRARPAVFSPFAPFRASWRLLYPIDVGSAKVMSVREGERSGEQHKGD